MKRRKLKSMINSKEDEILLNCFYDKVAIADERYMYQETWFLNAHERAIAEEIKNPHITFDGGYPEAERVKMKVIPEYIEEEETISVLRVTGNLRGLKHGDYLGAILGTGIERKVVGDILVSEESTDIIIDSKIEDFLLLNFTKIGRNSIKTEIRNIKELIVPKVQTKKFSGTVSSPRLDGVLSEVFNFSRGDAKEAIKKGIVTVNNVEELRPAREVADGDVLRVRGKGKAVIDSFGGKTRKGRFVINYSKYI